MTQHTHDTDTGGQDGRSPGDTPPGTAGGTTRRLVYGLALDQFDALDRSLRMIAAHGDVLASVPAADLAPGTLPVIGQAIHDEAGAVRSVLDQVESQRLDGAADTREGVEDLRAGYGPPALRLVGLRRQRFG